MSEINPGAFGATGVSFTQNSFFDLINGPTWFGSQTAAQTNTAFGSTLMLQRMLVPALMNITEVDVVLQLSFAASSLSGAGSMSQSFGVFKLANSTSLASVFSASSSWAWVTGSSSTALSGVQNGWSGMLLHSMGLSSASAGTSRLVGGDYVFGNLMNFSMSAAAGSAGGSNMSASLWGVNIDTGVTVATASGLSNARTAQVALISNAGTAVANLLSNAGTGAVNVLSNVGTGVAFMLSNAGTGLVRVPVASTTSAAAVTALSQLTAVSAATVFTAAPTAAAETVFTVAPTGAAETLFTVAPTAAAETVFTIAPTAASETVFTNAPTTVQVVTAVGLTANPVISVQGAGSAYTTASPSWFRVGIMATAGMPANITLTSTNVTITGTIIGQPWFALAGS